MYIPIKIQNKYPNDQAKYVTIGNVIKTFNQCISIQLHTLNIVYIIDKIGISNKFGNVTVYFLSILFYCKRIYIANAISTTIEIGIHIGDKTHHQLQVITCVSLSTINISVKISKKPSDIFI